MPPVNSARSNKDASAIQPSTSPPPSFKVGQSEEELFEEELGETGTGGAERDEVGRRGGGEGIMQPGPTQQDPPSFPSSYNQLSQCTSRIC